MINITFASIRNNKENLIPFARYTNKKSEPLPTSFKEIKELKEGHSFKPSNINSHKKAFENQQNTFFNALHQHSNPNSHKKNLLKIEKSQRKINQAQLCKSSSIKILQISQTMDKPNQVNNYSSKSNLLRHYESNTTPYLSKGNKSYTINQMYNLTDKQRTVERSQKGSISSKASIDDSFNLYPQDLSCEEDERSLRQKLDNVNSSVQICKDDPTSKTAIKEFTKCDIQVLNMKKSSFFYYSRQDNRSITSSLSSNLSNSINFSEKFKHYKRQHQAKNQVKSQKTLKLCHFKLLQEIGSGKYGKVYFARHKQTGFVCAIKSVSKKVIKQQNLEVPFMREVKIQMYLNHPNIVKLYGCFHDVQNIYLIMEYCSGSHLFKMIRQRKQFQEAQIIKILRNVFQAVSFIHCHGIIHRDLKPENIVIENGVYKLCDFGWAAYARGDNRTTFCGTPLYVCPEVLKGQEYNSKADIWGLGIITYELTFGRVPFSIISQGDLMKIIKDPVYFPVWGSTSQKLIPFIKRMLSKDPEERPSLNQILTSEVFGYFDDEISGELRRYIQKLF